MEGGWAVIKSTLTDKWQTTIPAEVRKALHLKPRQQLIYEVVDGAVVVKPQPETLKDLYGYLASDRPPASKSEERAAARKTRVSRYT